MPCGAGLVEAVLQEGGRASRRPPGCRPHRPRAQLERPSPFCASQNSLCAWRSVTARIALNGRLAPLAILLWTLALVGGAQDEHVAQDDAAQRGSACPRGTSTSRATSTRSPALSVPSRSWCSSPGSWRARTLPLSFARRPCSCERAETARAHLLAGVESLGGAKSSICTGSEIAPGHDITPVDVLGADPLPVDDV